MTFKQQLGVDAKNVFTNTDEFAENINYIPYSGTPKTIKAVITRDRLDTGNQDRNRTLQRHAEILIPNDATYGVVSVDRARDQVQFPIYKDGASSTWGIVEILSHDEGMWRLLVQY